MRVDEHDLYIGNAKRVTAHAVTLFVIWKRETAKIQVITILKMS